MTPTTYGRDFAYCLKSHGGVRGFYASLWRFLLRCTLFCHSVATFLTSVSSYEGGCGFEVLKNVSDNSIKVVWNEAVFVGFDGATSKVMHAGTKYSQREADQPATTIIKGAKIEDLAAPNCNIRYSDVLKEWVTESMYPSAPALSPGQLRLMLPIQIKEVINEYIFIFDVSYVYNHPERLNL